MKRKQIKRIQKESPPQLKQEILNQLHLQYPQSKTNCQPVSSPSSERKNKKKKKKTLSVKFTESSESFATRNVFFRPFFFLPIFFYETNPNFVKEKRERENRRSFLIKRKRKNFFFLFQPFVKFISLPRVFENKCFSSSVFFGIQRSST